MTDASSTAESPETVREERAYALGLTAYLWGFTMNEFYRVRSAMLSRPGVAVTRSFTGGG